MSRLENQKHGWFSVDSSSSWTRQNKVLPFLYVLLWLLLAQYHDVHGYSRITFCYNKNNYEDKRLNTTVHRRLIALSEFDCGVHCSKDSCCRSANFMKIPAQSDGRNNCELVHAIASEEHGNVVENKTYDHLVIVVPQKPFNCTCGPCKNNGSCDKSSNKCTCPDGLTGERCEKDVDECGSNPCDTNAKCNNTFGSYICECKKGFSGNGTSCTAKNCKELYKMNITQDGVYSIDPDGLGSFNVSCNMTKDEGGWTVFQRRLDGSVDFSLGWKEYKHGFGNMSGEFWLGLDKIHRLTKNNEMELRIDLEDFEGNKAFAKYKIFKVDAENQNYKLTVGKFTGLSTCRVKTTDGTCCVFPFRYNNEIYYSCTTAGNRNIPWCEKPRYYLIYRKWGNCVNPWPGDAGDSLAYHSGMKFSTKDKDNDVLPTKSCAMAYKSGWWYNACHRSNLNGEYLHGARSTFADGVIWTTWKGYYYSLKKTEMKIRPQKL